MEVSNSFMTIFLFSLTLLLLIIYYTKGHKNGIKLPPGPPKLPLIGNLHQLGVLPHVALKELASKYGPLMHLKLGQRSTIVISSYDTLKQVIKTRDTAFSNRPELLVSKTVGYNSGDLIFAPYGDYFKQMRKICVLELLSPKRVQSIYPLFEEEISRLVTSVHKASSAGIPINLGECLHSLTIAIICRASVGMACKDPDSLIRAMKEVLAGVFNISDLFPSLKFLHFITGTKRKLVKLHKECDELLEEIVREHEAQYDGERPMDQEDLLHVLLRLKESHNFQIPITRDNIKAIVLDLFIGGSETTGTILTWAMSELLKNPTVMERVQAEVTNTLKGKNTFDHSDIQKLKYLKMVIKETLRLHPPAPLALPKESNELYKINGYLIANKTVGIINMWAMGRDPEYWDDPEKFEPERFNSPNNNVETKLGSIPFELVAFGFGKRVCPGMSFGTANLELILARLLYHFDWKLPNGMNPEDLDMTEKFGGTLGRKNDLYLIASPRFPN